MSSQPSTAADDDNIVYLDTSTASRFRATGILNAQGHEAYRQSGGDGGGTEMKLTLPDLRWNVALLNGLASLFFIGLVGLSFWLVDRIDDKFEDADAKITEVSDKVSDLRVEIAGQSGDIKAVLEKLDDRSQEGPKTRETPAVSE